MGKRTGQPRGGIGLPAEDPHYAIGETALLPFRNSRGKRMGAGLVKIVDARVGPGTVHYDVIYVAGDGEIVTVNEPLLRKVKQT